MASRGTTRIGKLATHKTGMAPVDRAIGKVTDKVNEILAGSIADAVILEASLVLGTNKVSHGMGRAPTSFFWNTDRPGTVLSSAQADNPTPETTLWVVMASTFDACHAHLMVF